jgi:hypothetical protein
MATRKRAFHLSADRAAADLAQPVKIVNPGRGKKIAIAVAAVVAIAAVVLFTFGRDMLGGLLGEPPAAAPAVASSPTPATHSSSAPGAPSGASAQGASGGSPRASATTVANPSPATSRATIQASVTPAVGKPEHQKAAADPAAASKATDAGVSALPVPTVNVDAATRSIDEATKSTAQKAKPKLPF